MAAELIDSTILPSRIPAEKVPTPIQEGICCESIPHRYAFRALEVEDPAGP